MGGPAKASVVSSCLMASVSGSAVANVVTTGSFTIPLMKRIGYRPYFAGAVEACSSSGGQIMPPVMGAAAFVIAEFLNIPYLKVAVAGLFPAVIYFFSIFVMVHFEARKRNLATISAAEMPDFKEEVKRGGHRRFEPKEMSVYVEASVLSLPEIYINAGKRGLLARIAPDVLLRVLGAVPVHVAV